MKQAIGLVFVVLGVATLGVAGAGASRAANTGELVGMFLPGVALLVIGLSLRKPSPPKDGPPGTASG